MMAKEIYITEKHLDYCVTDQQRKIVQMKLAKATWGEVAKETGIESGNGRESLRAVKRRAAAAGYSPEHDMNKEAPEGYKLTGVSTLYNADGNVTAQWVKSKSDQARQLEILIESLEQGSTGYKPFKRTPKPKHNDSDLLTLITITDFHLGMYAWAAETSEAWDITISRDVFLNAVQDMIDGSPQSGTGLLNQLGDFLHFDSLDAVTPSSGHLLDSDTRYGKIVELSIEVMTQAVLMMLKRFEKVVVVQAEGNHDMAGSVWMRKHVKQVFKNEPRVEVIDNEFPYYAYLHGEVMLGFHHGHKVRLAQLHKLFASEPRFREMWGQAKNTYIHTGHYHHERVVEDGGAISEQHPTLSSRDSYATRGGWVSQRGAKAITYSKTEGEIHRITVRPRLE